MLNCKKFYIVKKLKSKKYKIIEVNKIVKNTKFFKITNSEKYKIVKNTKL